MRFAYITCLIFTSSVVAFGYDICPSERVNLAPKNIPFVAPSAIELVELDKHKLSLSKTTLGKLAVLREQFDNTCNKKPLTPQEFTPEEIRHLFKTEWAYPENK